MRAAVERCAELASEVKTQGCMLNTQYLEAEDDRAKCEAWEERADKAEAALANVTAERNEARRIAGQHRDAHESDTERRGGAPMRVRHPWERATPTEGETE